MSLTVRSPPAAEPLSLAEAKAHLRVTFSAEDAAIAALLAASRQRVEAALGLSLLTAAFREEVDAPAGPVALSRGPLIVLDAAATLGPDGAWTPLDPTALSARLADPPYLVQPPPGIVPPVRLQIDYHAGFGPDPADAPAGLKQAVLAVLAEAYAARDADAPARPSLATAEPWLAPFRRGRL